MSNYLADTTAIVEHLRGNKTATIFLKEYNPYISVVTVAELIQGSEDKHEQDVALKLCASLSELTINRKLADLAIELMKKFCLSHGLRFLDALVAATAMENRLALVTENLKHFRFINGLEVFSQKEAFTIS